MSVEVATHEQCDMFHNMKLNVEPSEVGPSGRT